MIGCPITEGFGVCAVIVVVVRAAFTVCGALTEVLPVELVSPAYAAERVFAPDAGNVIEQVPTATVAVQVSPSPSLTVTLPVGVPVPGDTGVTVKLMATGCPTTDGFGVCVVIAVVVAAWFTVWDAPTEALPMKLVSPTYVAVIVLVPVEVEVREQFAAATAAVQLAVPSLTVTLPVGVPLPGALAATVNATVYACPTTVGVVKVEVMVVAVFALFTVCELAELVLSLKLLLLPGAGHPVPVSVYAAVMLV